jgi:hypothetical protein
MGKVLEILLYLEGNDPPNVSEVLIICSSKLECIMCYVCLVLM